MNQQKGLPPEFLAILMTTLIVVAIAGVIGILIKVFYCWTLSKALSRVSERNRLMEPGMTWLLLIPFFDVIWNFFVVTRVPGSLEKEFRDRGLDQGSTYGKGIGMTAAVLYAVTFGMMCIPFVNYCGAVVGFVGLIFWIIFWIQITLFSGQLDSADADSEDKGRPRKPRRGDDDDEDERPRKPSRRPPADDD